MSHAVDRELDFIRDWQAGNRPNLPQFDPNIEGRLQRQDQVAQVMGQMIMQQAIAANAEAADLPGRVEPLETHIETLKVDDQALQSGLQARHKEVDEKERELKALQAEHAELQEKLAKIIPRYAPGLPGAILRAGSTVTLSEQSGRPKNKVVPVHEVLQEKLGKIVYKHASGLHGASSTLSEQSDRLKNEEISSDRGLIIQTVRSRLY